MEKINKMFFRKRIKVLIIVLFANFIFATLCYFCSVLSIQQIQVKDISGLTYNSTTDSPHMIFDTMPFFYHIFTFDFSADFFPKDDQYPNLFQTGDEPKTLRLELIHPKTLQVVIGYKDEPLQKVYLVSHEIKINAWNHVSLSYNSKQRLQITVNNKKTLSVIDSKFAPLINDFILGAGFDKQRSFTGLIKNANFHIFFKEINVLFYVLGSFWHYYLLLIFFQLLFLSLLLLKKARIEIKENRIIFSGFLLSFALIALFVLLLGALASPLLGNAKWIPFISILIPSFFLGINYLPIDWFKNKYIFLFTGLLLLGVMIVEISTYDILPWISVSGILIICCCLSVIPLLKYFTLITVGIFIFLFSINSVVFMMNYGSQNYVWTALVTAIVIWTFCFSLVKQNRSLLWENINKIGFLSLMIISFFLSLRSDALFLGSSEFHWNYYTGVVQTIRSGGELLWSAPSQYGFLNLLLPSLLPWTARNSFFIFQAFIFFICIGVIVSTLYKSFKQSSVFILLSLIAISLFYFADPMLIGPTLFPSSSVLRFLWCYIMLASILLEFFRGRILTNNIKWIISIAYIFGILWSGESLLYCTAIYGTYLFVSTIAFTKSKTKNVLSFILKNIAIIVSFLFIAHLIYFVITGHLPDWSMYFMYALDYASGYGELAILPWGIQWAIIITLASIVFILSRLYSTKKYSEWIVCSICFITLWVISSYYVGRAVVNNITALLPLIFYIFIVMTAVLIDAKFLSYRLMLTSIFLPWIVVGIIGGIGNPQFVEKAQHFKYAENIDSKSFQPDKELGNILDKLVAIKGTRIVYYGDPYNNPVLRDKKGNFIDILTGLPIPMTLLEVPISEKRRKSVIQRFFTESNSPVFLIHKKNENMQRFLEWKEFFEKYYSIKSVTFKSKNYEVIFIKEKKS
ncbi:MAG TPA: hypothetical protein VNW29_08105 [Candidatus Sulfotelmatobacter sp.]|jgi:hypothetical protein|nr:hypothetical protein [Candidatus Sulfotelmatobacter sp.]